MNSLIYSVGPMDTYAWEEFQRGYPGIEPTIAQLQRRINPAMDAFALEIFYRLYGQRPQRLPEAVIPPERQWAVALHDIALRSPEFAIAESRCTGNGLMAGLATDSLLRSLLAHCPTEVAPATESPERVGELRAEGQRLQAEAQSPTLTPAQAQAIQARLAEIKAEGPRALHRALEHGTAIANSETLEALILTAALSAWEQAQQVEAALSAIQGSGLGFEAQLRLAGQLAQDSKLRRIAQLAERIQAEARAKRRQRSRQAKSEVVGLELGNDLMRLLPSEVGKLALPETQAQFVRGLHERSLLQYKLGGKAPLQRGPIVFLLDDSGSMAKGANRSGITREVWAKALMLAIAQVALEDKRPFVVLHWGQSVARRDEFPAGHPNPERLREACQYFGAQKQTNSILAMEAAMAELQSEAYSRADIIYLSDGGWLNGVTGGNLRQQSEQFAQSWANFRAQHTVHCYALLVEHQRVDQVEHYLKPDRAVAISDLQSGLDIGWLFEAI